MANIASFDQHFRELTGVASPFPWQRRLFEFFTRGDFEACETCSLPTGLGKTSIIPIWLLALAVNPAHVPRRLVYVVNRRTVVDQASDEVKRIRERIAGGAVPEVRAALARMCGIPAEMPLAISTLRGQFADNAEWRIDPARPAVVVGTIDMIGSRLLFSGYGTGFRSRSVHAGLLGQDTLVIHDEAHLEPAFQQLLESMVREQAKANDIRPFRVVALTATSRAAAGKSFAINDEDLGNLTVAKRLGAKKRLRLHDCDGEKAVVEEMARKALGYASTGAAVLVFTRRVEDAERIAAALRKTTQLVAQLTGTMRGYERDQLATSDPVFARFLPGAGLAAVGESKAQTAYLVCTSAGEVGVNISADHLVCDLTPFDSMAQRLGRVNRFGDGDAAVDVFYPEQFDPKDPLLAQRAATLEVIRHLPSEGATYSASPLDLSKLPEEGRARAFTPSPTVVPVTDVLFDAWALTTIRQDMPGRPPVADWLHGVAEWQPPDTYVAWRHEVGVLGGTAVPEEAEDLLSDYPLKPHELLRDRQHRVFGQLERIAGRRPESRAWVVSPLGAVAVHSLGSLVEKTASNKPRVNLADCTVLLDPECGGLTASGTLDGDSLSASDVADFWIDENGKPRRIRIWDGGALPDAGPWRLVRLVDTCPDGDQEAPEVAPAAQRRLWKWYVRPRCADDDGSLASTAPQELSVHLKRAAEVGQQLTAALQLPADMADAVVKALAVHDLGKNRLIWQAAIGNSEYFSGTILAKSGGTIRPALLNAYRHELGSLLDLQEKESRRLSGLLPKQSDLALHLVAAHHGRARPHFPASEVFDPDHPADEWERAALEVPARFGRLQSQCGRWGLAWLEAIVRAADAIASQPQEGG
jgi:CRISPR-associated endonuclease/helicase Cas3